MSSSTATRLIIALDVSSLAEEESLLSALSGVVSYYKVGMELFTAHGWEAVRLVKKQEASVFLDLKFHDIPTTVARTAAVVCDHDIDVFNVHTLGGLEMMRAVRKQVDESCKNKKQKPAVLGVTILTSHQESELREDLGIGRNLKEQVIRLARLAAKAGLDGVVCSPQEIKLLRSEFPKNFLIVTPGIRPHGADTADQKRITTPAQAIQLGADYIVVGRPITAAENPREAAEEILRSILEIDRRP